MTQPRHVQVVLFGASMTWSMRAPYGRRYADCIESALAERLGPGVCVDVAACGAGGNTAREALPRVQRDIIDYQPDLVAVSLGANDAGRDDKPTFERSFLEVLRLTQTRTDAVVVLETTPVLDEEWHASRDGDRARAAGGLNKHLEAFTHSFVRAVASEQSLLLHDRFRIYHAELGRDPSIRARLIRRDGVHLTEAGNAYFAATLAELVTGRLAERPRAHDGGMAGWLEKAKANEATQRALAVAEDGDALKSALLTDEHVTRLQLQQARSFARRDSVCGSTPLIRAEASRLEALLAALLAAQRVVKPATPEAEAGSRAWALDRLVGISDVPAGLLDLLK